MPTLPNFHAKQLQPVSAPTAGQSRSKEPRAAAIAPELQIAAVASAHLHTEAAAQSVQPFAAAAAAAVGSKARTPPAAAAAAATLTSGGHAAWKRKLLSRQQDCV